MGAGSENLTGAATTYQAIFQEFFGEGVPGVAGMFTEEVPVSGKRLSIPITTSYPRIRRWLGDKVFESLRHFSQDVDVEPWEASTQLDRLDIETDQGGTVDSALRSFLGSEVTAFDDMVITELLTNPTGYDGVSLLNNSHPYSNSTGDNLTTDALSLTSLRAMDEQMRSFQDETGRPLMVSPNTLVVGEDLKDEALEITGADRPIYFDNTGAEATSSVIDAITIQNVRAGSHSVVVTPWITGTQWFLMDLRRPGLRPMITARFRAFGPQTQENMDSEGRFVQDVMRFSIEGDYGVAAGLWWLIGGKIAA